jgi:hypothetical protein
MAGAEQNIWCYMNLYPPLNFLCLSAHELICSHPHEDLLSLTHSFPWNLRVSSKRHGGAPPLLLLCACLHLRDDDGVGFYEFCILLLHELRGDVMTSTSASSSSTSCVATAMTFTSASSSTSCVVMTSTTTSSASASSTARQRCRLPPPRPPRRPPPRRRGKAPSAR